jgi:hypothetical protein
MSVGCTRLGQSGSEGLITVGQSPNFTDFFCGRKTALSPSGQGTDRWHPLQAALSGTVTSSITAPITFSNSLGCC